MCEIKITCILSKPRLICVDFYTVMCISMCGHVLHVLTIEPN